MKPWAYYNEIDEYAATWLRNLIAAGHIAPGEVDTRSIEDVQPDDLRGFTQCHFFAGIGVWSLALRRAGWADDRPVWTGSCPCQPFSQAGEGAGFADERHLWPTFHHLIREHRPAAVLGEQVASKDADPWVDLVHTDLEALGYAFGAIPFPSASIGAPHIRDRLFWVANANDGGRQRGRAGKASNGRDAARIEPERLRDAGGLAYAGDRQRDGLAVVRGFECNRQDSGRQEGSGEPKPRRQDDGLQFPDTTGPEFDTHDGLGGPWEHSDTGQDGRLENADLPVAEQFAREWAGSGEAPGAGAHDQPNGRGELAKGQPATGPTNGYWSAADWLSCRDGKWRPVEPGTFPLAHGDRGRVGRVRAGVERNPEIPRKDQGHRAGRLRGYGNAINAEEARIFIEAVMEAV
jgi:DNA (cytosine-5)-methyltransferase 1